jgi:drug/metabolite transporter (DMT)-like permease
MIVALGIYAITVVLYTVLLQQVPLSRAYMFSLGASTMVAILAIFLFNEAFNVRYAIGAILVFAGVIISTSS